MVKDSPLFGKLAYVRNTDVSLTGTTALTVLDSYVLPGGFPGQHGMVRVWPLFSCNNDASTKTGLVRVNSTSRGQVQLANQQGSLRPVHIYLGSNTNAWVWAVSSGNNNGYGQVGNAGASFAVDWSTDTTLQFTGQLADSTDTMTLRAAYIEANYLFDRNQGLVYWNPYLLGSFTDSSVTGTTTRTLLKRVTVPGGWMGTNGVLRIDCTFGASASPSSMTRQVEFGGNVVYSNSSTSVGLNRQILIWNRGATNSQAAFPNGSTTGLGLTTGSPVSLSVNTDSSFDIDFYCELTNSADTGILHAFTVEILKPWDNK